MMMIMTMRTRQLCIRYNATINKRHVARFRFAWNGLWIEIPWQYEPGRVQARGGISTFCPLSFVCRNQRFLSYVFINTETNGLISKNDVDMLVSTMESNFHCRFCQISSSC